MRHSSSAHEFSCHHRVHAGTIKMEAGASFCRYLGCQHADFALCRPPPVLRQNFFQISALHFGPTLSLGISHGREQASGIPPAHCFFRRWNSRIDKQAARLTAGGQTKAQIRGLGLVPNRQVSAHTGRLQWKIFQFIFLLYRLVEKFEICADRATV